MFTPDERSAAEAIAALCYENPFLPGRDALEQRALGPAYLRAGHARHSELLADRAAALVEKGHRALAAGHPRRAGEDAVYEGLVRYHLFERLHELLHSLSLASQGGGLTRRRVTSYKLFAEEAERLLTVPGKPLSLRDQLPHLFAILFQLRRAFHLIDARIMGTSKAAVGLRSSVWQSIFTHDMARYERGLYQQMQKFPTLVVGPSGTGKELVAEAIGMARYIPFDEAGLRFVEESVTSFHAVNISALSSGVLESELFGHRKGAFTGADADRQGYFELCAEHGCLFLDEIGELDLAVQVKLLRVLQSRTFMRVGDTESRSFAGKLVVATNRDLALAMRAGDFREDLYYRLCADAFQTPALVTQLRQAPDDLGLFVEHILAELLPEEERTGARDEVVRYVDQHLPQHTWPGNVRELAQCVRSVLLRGRYDPPVALSEAVDDSALSALAARFTAADFDADGLLDAYCTLMYKRTGSYQEAARRLGIDRRTVKSRVNDALLAELS